MDTGRERRMILRALYDSLMMEDPLRKFHRFERKLRDEDTHTMHTHKCVCVSERERERERMVIVRVCLCERLIRFLGREVYKRSFVGKKTKEKSSLAG